MATTTSNVTAAKPKVGGAAYVGDSSATLPTSSSATLTGFTALGYIGEDGLKNANSPESETFKAWGGDIVLSSMTERQDTFTLKLIEILNADVLKIVYKDSDVTGTLSGTDGITVKASASQLSEKPFVFDMVLRNDVAKRIVVPKGAVTEVSEIVYSEAEVAGYEVTITAFPDSSGYTHYEYIK